MGIQVQLRDERGAVLVEVSDADMVLARASSSLSNTRLLKYLVPWGDAVFNQAQAADLDADIVDLVNARAGTPLAQRLNEVRPLVARLAAETHVYLWFAGD